MKNNEQLQRDVLEELRWEPSVDAAAIGVTSNDGVISLTGHVPSYATKVAAEKATKRVEGVHGMANEIEVRLPRWAKRDDADIARAALDAIEWNVDLPEDRIQVLVKDGWVTLEGDVDWRYQRMTTEDVVRRLTGVRGVTNLISVKATVRAEDVKAKIEAALKRSAQVEAQRIQVEAHDGTVTLRGTVHSWAERNAVERAAWAAPGVTKVDDQLTIRIHAYV